MKRCPLKISPTFVCVLFHQPVLEQIQTSMSGIVVRSIKKRQKIPRRRAPPNKPDDMFLCFVRQTNQIARICARCSQNQSKLLLVFACSFRFVCRFLFVLFVSLTQVISLSLGARAQCVLFGANTECQDCSSVPGNCRKLKKVAYQVKASPMIKVYNNQTVAARERKRKSRDTLVHPRQLLHLLATQSACAVKGRVFSAF